MSRHAAPLGQALAKYGKGSIVDAIEPSIKSTQNHHTQVFRMTLIIAIVLGLIAGQYIKLTVDPTLIDFFRRSWALATEKAPLVKGFATDKISEAVEAVTIAKMGPKQRAVKGAFKAIAAEAKTKEGLTNGTPTA
jgi:hypothetical protein